MNRISLIRYQRKNLNIYRYFAATSRERGQSKSNDNDENRQIFRMRKLHVIAWISRGPIPMKSNYAPFAFVDIENVVRLALSGSLSLAHPGV